ATEEDPDQDRDAEGEGHRTGGDDRLHGGDAEVAHGHAGGGADEPAEPGEEHGLGQELGQDVAGLGAERLADADLPGPLGHRDEHDVHDADPADDEGDAGHDGQQDAEGAGGGLAGGQQVGGVEDPEVGRVVGFDGMRLAQDLGHLGGGRVDGVAAGGLDADDGVGVGALADD